MSDYHQLVQDFLAQAVEASGWTLSRIAKEVGVSASTLTRTGPENKHLLSLKIAYQVSELTGVSIPQAASSKPAIGDVVKDSSEVAMLRFWRARDEEERRAIIRLLQIDVPAERLDRRVA